MFEFWKGKRVLITGHTGFKGGWLSHWLKMLGSEVCGYALAPGSEPNLFSSIGVGEQIRSVIGDIRDREFFTKIVGEFKPELVFHLAAQSLVRRSYRQPVETYETNVLGTVNLFEAVRSVENVRAVVAVTTDKVYENREWDWPYRENDVLGGFDPYSNSKACTEMLTAAYRNSFFTDGGTLVATARAGNVIGGGDWAEDRLIPDVFRSLIFGENLVIRNPGSIRPWQHVIEPLSGYMMLAERLYAGDRPFATAWNFGPGEEDSKSVSWILETIRTAWDEAVKWEIRPDSQLHEAGTLKLDATKARTQLHWRPKLRTDEAVKLTGEWYREFKNKGDLQEMTSRQIDLYMKDQVIADHGSMR
jgi:CDP-glucose 4,6-dehydratase